MAAAEQALDQCWLNAGLACEAYELEHMQATYSRTHLSLVCIFWGEHLLLGQGDGAVFIDGEDQAAVDAQLACQLGLQEI